MLSFQRTNIAQTVAVILVTVAALALLVLIAAHWTWQWLSPPPEPRAQPAVNLESGMATAHGLFGKLPSGNGAAAPTGIAIKLLGSVAAATGQHGYAILQIEPGNTLSVREGEDISPGIRLAEVNTDHVILERSGIRETLALPERSTAAAEPAAPQIKK